MEFNDRQFIEKNFSSIVQFEKDEELKNQFFHLVERSFDFIKGPNYIITHSPCEEKYLGKLDLNSIKHQRNFRHSHLTNEQLKEKLKFLEEYTNNRCFPFHIWGHIALKNILKNGPEIGIDGGCYVGGQLNAVYITKDKPHFISVPSIRVKTEELLDLSYNKSPIKYNVSFRDAKRLKGFIKTGVNFLSGTMCPADKIEEDLESLQWALEYYKNANVSTVVMQKKMMGSRLNTYLFYDLDKCYSITKNGFRLPDSIELELKSEYERLINKFKLEFDDDLYLRILDGELLPWSLLGEDLINRTFFGYAELCEKEIILSQQYGFEDCLKKIENSLMGHEYRDLSKKEFIEKHKHHIYETHENYYTSRKYILPADIEINEIGKFRLQSTLYGSSGPTKIEPFAILKDVYLNGSEKLRLHEDNFEQWNLVNEDKQGCFKCSINDIEDATEIFNSLVLGGEEGVVVKPLYNVSNAAPYIKVRNKDYLRIIYGHDYHIEVKYNKLLQRKRIKKKLIQSIKEYNIGKKILSIPYDEINKDNDELILLYKEFICEEQKYNDIDPRL